MRERENSSRNNQTEQPDIPHTDRDKKRRRTPKTLKKEQEVRKLIYSIIQKEGNVIRTDIRVNYPLLILHICYNQ